MALKYPSMKNNPGFIGKAFDILTFKDNPFGIFGIGKLEKIGLSRKMIGPGLVLGLGLGRQIFSNLIEGGYSTDSPRAAWGYTPGAITEPYEGPMAFSRYSGSSMDATGSLVFALNNQRKR